jgi:hypothetical protein
MTRSTLEFTNRKKLADYTLKSSFNNITELHVVVKSKKTFCSVKRKEKI